MIIAVVYILGLAQGLAIGWFLWRRNKLEYRE